MTIKPDQTNNYNNRSFVISEETELIDNELGSIDFEVTFKRLLELKEIDTDLDEDDENEISCPSDYAFNGSVKLLYQLHQDLGSAFPRGYASVESRGGVDLIWNNQDKNKKVWFQFPNNPHLKSSVYYQKDHERKLIKQPEVRLIAKLLQWLVTEDSLL